MHLKQHPQQHQQQQRRRVRSNRATDDTMVGIDLAPEADLVRVLVPLALATVAVVARSTDDPLRPAVAVALDLDLAVAVAPAVAVAAMAAAIAPQHYHRHTAAITEDCLLAPCPWG